MNGSCQSQKNSLCDDSSRDKNKSFNVQWAGRIKKALVLFMP